MTAVGVIGHIKEIRLSLDLSWPGTDRNSAGSAGSARISISEWLSIDWLLLMENVAATDQYILTSDMGYD